MASPGMTNTRRQLQRECSRALQYYVRIMQEGCDLLGELKQGLIPDYQRQKIFSNRKQEMLAFAAYTRAQTLLWTLLSDPRLTRLADTLPAEENVKGAE